MSLRVVIVKVSRCDPMLADDPILGCFLVGGILFCGRAEII